jgi:EF hand
MNRLLIGGAVLAGLSLLVAVSLAKANHGFAWRQDTDVVNLIEQYDVNKDGKVSQEEIDSNRTRWHADFDTDKSGDLNFAEFEQLWLKSHHEQIAREFRQLDRDGDGRLTLQEYKHPTPAAMTATDRDSDGISTEDRYHWNGEEKPPRE